MPPENTRKEKKWGHNPDTWMVILTGLLMLIGVGTAKIFYNQFTEMQKQTEILSCQAEQAAKDSADSGVRQDSQLNMTRQQVAAAQDSVEAVRRQMRQDQRPWVVVNFDDSPVTAPERTVSADTFVHAPIIVFNSGKTPARHLKVNFFIEVGKNGESPNLESNREPDRKLTSGVFTPAFRGFVPVIGSRKPSSTEYQDLLHGRAYIAVHGVATYSDVFNIKHWTKFCVWYGFANNFTDAGKCADYNDVDNNVADAKEVHAADLPAQGSATEPAKGTQQTERPPAATVPRQKNCVKP